jgi:uncharacterized membrane protein SpoIIM required for sporulation
MNMPTFIRKNRDRWERLEELLGLLDKKSPSRLTRDTIRELSTLYRACSSDLAYAQTYYPGTTLLLFLHQLTGRAHHQIYRTEPFSLRSFKNFFRFQVPEAARQNFGAILLSAIILVTSFALGLTAANTDPQVAALVIPQPVLEDIYAGRPWTQNLFSAVPAVVSSALLFTNNISIAFLCFAGGMTGGFYTVLLLGLNGFILGVVFKLCANHGLLGSLLEFIASHGLVELSVIVVAGAAGLILAGALLSPGNYSRRDALSLRGKSAIRLALGCVPPLIATGLIEAFISPVPSIPGGAKVMLGLVLFASYWFYLLAGGQPRDDATANATVRVDVRRKLTRAF